VRGWLGLYRTSVGLGLRHLARRGYLREAVIRVLVPLDPSRYLELPEAKRELAAEVGDRVLDLASPKLLAVQLGREGVHVTSVDAFEDEIERWRRLAADERNVRFERADGRALPYGDASFDHAYSISVLEHIPAPGDEEALRELARVVKPGGRVVITLPYARTARDEHRKTALYGAEGTFFQRWYDDAALDRLAAAAPAIRLQSRRIVRLQPNLNTAYNRVFPWLLPLGPFFGLLARERDGVSGDVVRLTFGKPIGGFRRTPL
jgi:SAM-dependent methyltransferase